MWVGVCCVFMAMDQQFDCYHNLKPSLTYYGKIEKFSILLYHCEYFDKSFMEMLLEYQQMKFIQMAQLFWLPW